MLSRESIISHIQEITSANIQKFNFEIKYEDSAKTYKCTKSYIWGYDYTTLPNVRFASEDFSFGINLFRRINKVEEIWQEYSKELNLVSPFTSSYKDITTLNIGLKYAYPDILNKEYYDTYFGVLKFSYTESQIKSIEDLLRFLIDKLIHSMNELNNIKKIDKIINSKFEYDENIHGILSPEGLMFKRIIISKLAGSSEYEALCNYFRQFFPWYEEESRKEGNEFMANYPIVFEEVYNKLKEVKGESNLILS